MKRVFLSILVLCLLPLAAACEKPVQTPNFQPPAPSKTENVEADSIRYYVSSSASYEVFVLNRDGKYGILDADGNVLVEPVWDSVTLAPTADSEAAWETAEVKLFLSNNAENGMPETEGVFVNPDGTTEEGGWARWNNESCSVYWDVTNEQPVVFSHGADSDAYWGADISVYSRRGRTYPYYRADATADEQVIAVQALESYQFTQEGTSGRLESVTTAKDGKYALLSLETGKLVTDFLYTEHDPMGEVDGIIAMKKDSGWGYVGSAGNEITDFCYLPAFHYLGIGRNGEQRQFEGMYPPANGFLTVNEGEVFGFLSVNEGKLLVSPQYSAVSMPNTEGVYWAKNTDGTWSRHSLLG